MTPEIEFRAAISKSGLTPPDQIMADGKLHRFASNGKRSDDAGWYIFYPDGVAAGAYGCWRTDLKGSWRANIGRPLTPVEEKAYQAKVDAARREREREEARHHAEAAKKARDIWTAAIPARGDHPYLTCKRVSPVESLQVIEAAEVVAIAGYEPKSRGEPLAGRLLVAPVKVAGELSTVEFIDGPGRKAALYGGKKAGGYWAAQPLPEDNGTGLTLLIGEGVATALSAREATGNPGIAALSSGNLVAVASEMRERYPAAVLVILADLGNGRDKAEEAAQAVGGQLAVPDFGEDRPDWASDFNDLAQLNGLEAVRRAITDNSVANQGDAPGPAVGATTTEPGPTDLGNAHRFARDHRGDVRYCWPWGRWLVWNGRYWCRDETGEIHRRAEATVRGIYEEAARSSPERREVLAKWAVGARQMGG
jgi:putative DNA primase/helicase